MTKRHDEAFAAVRNCVARDKVRCLPNEAGELEYFTTAKGASILAGVGIDTHLARHPVDGDRLFGMHVRRLTMEGPRGLLKRFGSVDKVSAAFSGAQVVPFTEQVVAENIADGEAVARRFAEDHLRSTEKAKPAYLRKPDGFSR